MALADPYAAEELAAIYELGRLYFEMGFYPAAEKIFAGLAVVDNGLTPARIGLGLIRIDNGQCNEAATYFRSELPDGHYKIQAKLGMVVSFIELGELPRARSLLGQIDKDLQNAKSPSPELEKLFHVLLVRCA